MKKTIPHNGAVGHADHHERARRQGRGQRHERPQGDVGTRSSASRETHGLDDRGTYGPKEDQATKVSGDQRPVYPGGNETEPGQEPPTRRLIKERLRVLQENRDKNMKTLLSEEQYTKWEELRKTNQEVFGDEDEKVLHNE